MIRELDPPITEDELRKANFFRVRRTALSNPERGHLGEAAFRMAMSVLVGKMKPKQVAEREGVTPTIVHPYARRPACMRGTGIVWSASGETNDQMNESHRPAEIGYSDASQCRIMD